MSHREQEEEAPKQTEPTSPFLTEEVLAKIEKDARAAYAAKEREVEHQRRQRESPEEQPILKDMSYLNPVQAGISDILAEQLYREINDLAEKNKAEIKQRLAETPIPPEEEEE